jgi:hypothetical protein|tara:strand:+ start:108 stop:503 length:396 start_codon:yes stop_codon:yes gene_type:complete
METQQNYFQKIKGYLVDLDYMIKVEDEANGLFVIEREEEGIYNLVLDCEDPILIMEQFLFEIKNETPELYKSLLVKNRDIVHGAFVLHENKVSFRDTLQIENLDRNEIEGSINSLSLLMTEYNRELIEFSK